MVPNMQFKISKTIKLVASTKVASKKLISFTKYNLEVVMLVKNLKCHNNLKNDGDLLAKTD